MITILYHKNVSVNHFFKFMEVIIVFYLTKPLSIYNKYSKALFIIYREIKFTRKL